jgi:hypothetical protein
MTFERSDLLKAILDSLAVDENTTFRSIQQRVFAKASSRGMLLSTSTAQLVFQEIRDELSSRFKTLVSEMERVLESIPVDDSGELAECLIQEFLIRIDPTTRSFFF